MMGRLNHDQGQLFYSFCLEGAVPDDHLVREIAAVLDLAWMRAELAPYYSSTGRPSIDPELRIRMLIRDVQVNFAYRWFVGSRSKTRSRTIRCSRVRATTGSVTATSFAACSSASSRPASGLVLSAGKVLQS